MRHIKWQLSPLSTLSSRISICLAGGIYEML